MSSLSLLTMGACIKIVELITFSEITRMVKSLIIARLLSTRFIMLCERGNDSIRRIAVCLAGIKRKHCGKCDGCRASDCGICKFVWITREVEVNVPLSLLWLLLQNKSFLSLR
jgi:7-cyano-7-deazaguanine synthase in queuosine biosynthesis